MKPRLIFTLILTLINVYMVSAFYSDTTKCKMYNVKGAEVKLSQFTGKVVYLHFWASWCGPCKQFFVYSTELKQKFTDEELKKIEFVYVSVDEDEAAWRKALEKVKVEGDQWISPSKLTDGAYVYFKITSIPRFIIIDKKGKISEFIAKTPYMNDVFNDLHRLINE